MNLTDLKTKSTQDLIDIAKEMGLDNMARSRKQDIIFAVLKRHAKSGEDIYGDGVLEILQDGLASCAPPTAHTWPDPTISTSHPVRFADSICAPVIPSPEKFDHRKTASAILPC